MEQKVELVEGHELVDHREGLTPLVVDVVAQGSVQLLVVCHGYNRQEFDAIVGAWTEIESSPGAQHLDGPLLRMLELHLILQELLTHVLHFICEYQLVLAVLYVSYEFLLHVAVYLHRLEQRRYDQLLERLVIWTVQYCEVESALVQIVDARLIESLDETLNAIEVALLVAVIDWVASFNVSEVVDAEVECSLDRPRLALPRQ